MILTDGEEKQLQFYESLGYKNTKSLKSTPLNTFVIMKHSNLNSSGRRNRFISENAVLKRGNLAVKNSLGFFYLFLASFLYLD